MRQVRYALTGLFAATLALTSCGDDTSGRSAAAASMPAGWGRLATAGADVSYPPGFREQTDSERSKYNAAVAVRTENGTKVALISVQLDFTNARNPEQAAIGAEAGVQLGATLGDTTAVSLRGAADARRVDFDFDSTGEANTPPKGTRIHGVILTGLDSREKTFQIRIDAAPGVLPDTDLQTIIDSIEVH